MDAFYRIMKVAKKLRDEGLKAYFAISNKDEMRQELEECGVAQKSGDKPVVCAYDEKGRKFNLQEEFTYVNVFFLFCFCFVFLVHHLFI